MSESSTSICAFDDIPDGHALIVRTSGPYFKCKLQFLTRYFHGFSDISENDASKLVDGDVVYDPSLIPEPTTWIEHTQIQNLGMSNIRTRPSGYGALRDFGMGHIGVDVALVKLQSPPTDKDGFLLLKWAPPGPGKTAFMAKDHFGDGKGSLGVV